MAKIIAAKFGDQARQERGLNPQGSSFNLDGVKPVSHIDPRKDLDRATRLAEEACDRLEAVHPLDRQGREAADAEIQRALEAKLAAGYNATPKKLEPLNVKLLTAHGVSAEVIEAYKAAEDPIEKENIFRGALGKPLLDENGHEIYTRGDAGPLGGVSR